MDTGPLALLFFYYSALGKSFFTFKILVNRLSLGSYFSFSVIIFFDDNLCFTKSTWSTVGVSEGGFPPHPHSTPNKTALHFSGTVQPFRLKVSGKEKRQSELQPNIRKQLCLSSIGMRVGLGLRGWEG